MATTEPLIFVIATAAQLPQASTCLEVLQEAQATGPSTGFALRIFSKGAKHSDLGLLPVDGLLTGEQRRSSDGTQLLWRFMSVAVITIWAPVAAPRTEKIGSRCNQEVCH